MPGKATVLMTIGKVKVKQGGPQRNIITFTAGLAVDADGSPRAYHPDGRSGLDHLANAGSPGNWWGIVTENGKASGKPVIQKAGDPAPGFYVSCTSYFRKEFKLTDPRRYVDAEKVPYVVVPKKLRNAIPPKFLGCRCVVTHRVTGKSVECVVADIGPNNKIGEGSIALAKALGINAKARNGGVAEAVLDYTIYAGMPAVVNGEHFTLI